MVIKIPPHTTVAATQLLVHDFSSNTYLSGEEIIGIKNRNPAEALRILVKSQGFSSVGRSSGYLAISGGEISVDIIIFLVS